MSAFAALAARHLAPAFDLHADSFVHRPMVPAANVNARPVADPDRAVTALRGVYYDPAAASRMPQAFSINLERPPGMGQSFTPRVEFHPDAVQGVTFRIGDLLERAGGAALRITRPWLLPTGIAVCDVNQIT